MQLNDTFQLGGSALYGAHHVFARLKPSISAEQPCAPQRFRRRSSALCPSPPTRLSQRGSEGRSRMMALSRRSGLAAFSVAW